MKPADIRERSNACWNVVSLAIFLVIVIGLQLELERMAVIGHLIKLLKITDMIH